MLRCNMQLGLSCKFSYALTPGIWRGIPAMIALVDAMAGMMFFTTPCVRDHVTPSILNSFALAAAALYSQEICSGSSVSIFLSGAASLSQRVYATLGNTDAPPCTRGHSKTEAHSIQCSGKRGVFAMVQIGNAVCLLSMSNEHS